MQKLSPILVTDRFPALLDQLLDLLSRLSKDEWSHPTSLSGWNVKDIVQHLLGDDVSLLSRKRDHFSEHQSPIHNWNELVALLNQRNDLWVHATSGLSPQLLCQLLRFTGDQVNQHFKSLDSFKMGGSVSWAGSEPAPVWLDIAREFTERWHHQQHIRDAVGMPGATDPFFLQPVLAAFVYALPQTFKDINANQATAITLTIEGPSGGIWSLIRDEGKWQLFSGHPGHPNAETILPEDTAWRLFTKGIDANQARQAAQLIGDQHLAELVLETISIIA